jgi:hypothetical protein
MKNKAKNKYYTVGTTQKSSIVGPWLYLGEWVQNLQIFFNSKMNLFIIALLNLLE